MVSTRGHPNQLPGTESSPSKSTRARSRSPVKRASRSPAPAPSTASPSKRASRAKPTLVPELPAHTTDDARAASPAAARSTRSRRSPVGWSHTPSLLTLGWLAVSLPLVLWDSGYVFGRPHTMAGGKYVWPLYNPYLLYAKVDYMYGDKAWEARNGFTAAQAFLNILETAAYAVYLWLVYAYSEHQAISGRGAPSKKVVGRLAHSRTLHGSVAAYAVLLAFSAAVMTLSKTVLYWANEAFAGFSNIGHNSASSLFFLWIVPNGAWLVFPTYMIYVFGAEIVQGLETASGVSKKTV